MAKNLDTYELVKLSKAISPEVARALINGYYIAVPRLPTFYSFPHSGRNKKTAKEMLTCIKRRKRIDAMTEEVILIQDDEERVKKHQLVLCHTKDIGLPYGGSFARVIEAAKSRKLELLPAKLGPMLQEHLVMAQQPWTKESCIYVMSNPVIFSNVGFIFSVGQSGIRVVSVDINHHIAPGQKLLFGQGR